MLPLHTSDTIEGILEKLDFGPTLKKRHIKSVLRELGKSIGRNIPQPYGHCVDRMAHYLFSSLFSKKIMVNQQTGTGNVVIWSDSYEGHEDAIASFVEMCSRHGRTIDPIHLRYEPRRLATVSRHAKRCKTSGYDRIYRGKINGFCIHK
jgi:hypothetical protein